MLQNQIGHLNWLRPMQVGWQTGAVNLAPQTDQGGQACRSTWLINNDQPRGSGSLVDVDQPINQSTNQSINQSMLIPPSWHQPRWSVNSGRSTAAAISSMFSRNLTFVKIGQETREVVKTKTRGGEVFGGISAFRILMVALTFLSIKNIVMHQYLGFQMWQKNEENPSVFSS